MTAAPAKIAEIERLLRRTGDAGTTVPFWWRDDDAVEPSPALDRLIAMTGKAAIPLALAVVPDGASRGMADHVMAAAHLSVLQHGFAHRNHADKAAGERASEFPDSRPDEAIREDLDAGAQRLADLFGDRALPVLVPPWNRIGRRAASIASGVGIAGLSTFGPVDQGLFAGRQVNALVDPVDWKAGAVFRGPERTWRQVIDAVGNVISGESPAVGLVTHHLDHDDGVWAFLADLIALTEQSPTAQWVGTRRIFALD